MAGDVHEQEGEVVADVGDSERAVELEAVDGLDPVAEQDVLGPQVTMAVADAPGHRTLHELRAESLECCAAEARERLQSLGRRAGVCECRQCLLDHGCEPRPVVRFLDGRRGMEGGDGGADGEQVARVRGAAMEMRSQCRGLVVAPHLDGVVESVGVMFRRDAQSVRPAWDQGDDAEVQRRREAPVECDLSSTARAPSQRCLVVEKGEPDWFLDLVGLVAGQEDPGDVRLAQLDGVGAVRIGRRVEQRVR